VQASSDFDAVPLYDRWGKRKGYHRLTRVGTRLLGSVGLL
jgi:hypothetical protein